MKLECSRRIFFKKYSNIKFHENPSSGRRVVPCLRTDTTKLVAFRNFANEPKTRIWVYTEWNWNLQSCACAVAAITRNCDRACTVITQFTDTISSTAGGMRSITGMGDNPLKEAGDELRPFQTWCWMLFRTHRIQYICCLRRRLFTVIEKFAYSFIVVACSSWVDGAVR